MLFCRSDLGSVGRPGYRPSASAHTVDDVDNPWVLGERLKSACHGLEQPKPSWSSIAESSEIGTS